MTIAIKAKPIAINKEIIVDGKKEKLWYITPKNRKRGIMVISKTMPSQLIDYQRT